jgi:hypothetical protein
MKLTSFILSNNTFSSSSLKLSHEVFVLSVVISGQFSTSPCYFYFSFEVDFGKFEGRYAGSSNVVKIQRNMEKHSDVENCPALTCVAIYIYIYIQLYQMFFVQPLYTIYTTSW